MNKTIHKTFVLLLCVLLLNVCAYASGAIITAKDVSAHIGQEHNRGFGHCYNMAAVGTLTLFDFAEMRGGFSYGGLGDVTELRAFAGAHASPIPSRPWWGLKAQYIYENLTDYDISTHSILTLATRTWKRAGLEFGGNFRYNMFFGETALFESMLSYSGYYDIISNDNLRLRAVLGNYGDFRAKTVGSSSLSINTEIYISENWALTNDVQFYQSGNEPFSTNFYGLGWRGGAKYLW